MAKRKNWLVNFIRYIKNKRKEVKMTQGELAEKTGVNPSYISRLENGSFISVKVEFFVGVAEVFEEPIEKFMKKIGVI